MTRTSGIRPIVVLVAILEAATAAYSDPKAVGRIKLASGTTYLLRQNQTLDVRAGDVVFESDVLKTGADGRLGLTLKDDTRLSLEPNTEIELSQFVFVPAETRFGFVLKIVRGLVAYVSGRMAKLSPDAIRLETPDGIVGIRGTRLVIRVGP